MPYAEGRTFYDADSHIMELPDFLIEHADPDMRARLPRIMVGVGQLREGLAYAQEHKAHSPDRVGGLVALGNDLIAGPKDYLALGAFNPGERSQALDQLGFRRQLVFSTFSAAITFSLDRPINERYGAARAHNRAMAAFCSADRRLFGVALLPVDDTDLALAEIDHIIKLGLKAAWVPHRPCGGRSPGHNDLDPVWAMLADAGIPFVLHVNGVAVQVDRAWMETGRPVVAGFLGGDEAIRAKDMSSLHQPGETFLSCLVLDGVLERHRDLRGGVIELSAGWVPAMLERLDWSAEVWGRAEPELRAFSRKPSQQIREQLAFTPNPLENVGELIRRSDPSLYMFSTDYPHPEGSHAPLKRFGAALAGVDAPALDLFYSGNFARVFGED